MKLVGDAKAAAAATVAAALPIATSALSEASKELCAAIGPALKQIQDGVADSFTAANAPVYEATNALCVEAHALEADLEAAQNEGSSTPWLLLAGMTAAVATTVITCIRNRSNY